MRRAVISDIHGNFVAFEAALADCKAQNVDEIVCLGDVCGYGPQPIACVDRAREPCRWVLCGNHVAALFMGTPIAFNKFARDAIEYHRRIMRPHWYSFSVTTRRWKWLENLLASRSEGDVLYVHASPRDPLLEYVEESDFADMGFGPTQKAQEIFEKFERLSFCGHSHRPGVVGQDYRWFKPHELTNMSYRLQPGTKTLVNVGSIGQPRDNNPDGCYVIYDDEEKNQTITFKRVKYDVKKAQERFKDIPELHEKLWRRLETGN